MTAARQVWVQKRVARRWHIPYTIHVVFVWEKSLTNRIHNKSSSLLCVQIPTGLRVGNS